jgi:hypothetical protein
MSKLDNTLFEQAKELVKAMDKTVDDNLPQNIADIVKFHAKGAAISSLGSAWVPGAGGAAAAIACAGFVWTMYGKIGSEIGLPISKNILKSLASGVATNIASYVLGMIALSTAFSFLPGLGNIGASVIMGGTSYALTLTSGYIYLKIMTQLFRKGVDPTTLSEQEFNDIARDMKSDSDVKDVMKSAKEEFNSQKDKGQFNQL